MYYFQTLWLILLLWLYSSFPSIFPKYNLYLDHYTRHLSLYPIEKKVLFLFSHTEVRLTNLKVKNVHSNYIFYIVLQRYSWLQTKHQILVDLKCAFLKSMNPSINESFIWLCQMLKTITIDNFSIRNIENGVLKMTYTSRLSRLSNKFKLKKK